MLKKPVVILSVVLFLTACALPFTKDKEVVGALDRYEKAYFRIIGKTETWPKDRDTMATVLQRINFQYVDKVDTNELITKAISGLNDSNSSVTSPTERALSAITASLDKNTGYLTPAAYKRYQENLDGQFTGFGFRIEMRDKKIVVITPLEGSSAKEAGILPDDVITHLNGESLSKYSFQEAIGKLRGPKGSRAILTITRPGIDAPIELDLERRPIDLSVVDYNVDGDVGYIRIHSFNRKTAKKVDEALTHFDTKLGTGLCGVIIDMRNNPGGLVTAAVDVVDQFLEDGNIFAAINRGRSFSEEYASDGDRIHGRPIMVMLNKGSASASEIVAGALQSQDRAKIFGQQSYGKGTMQTLYDLDNGGGLRLTTGRFTAGGGISFNGTGLNPDIPDAEVSGESVLAPVARAGKAMACTVSIQTATAEHAQ